PAILLIYVPARLLQEFLCCRSPTKSPGTFQLGQRHAQVRIRRKDHRALDEALKLADDLKEGPVFLAEISGGFVHGRHEYASTPELLTRGTDRASYERALIARRRKSTPHPEP